MELKGIEPRLIGESFEEVLVLQPTDDGNQGGHFEARSKNGRKAWGQEVWVRKLGTETLERLKADPNFAFESSLIAHFAPHIFQIIEGEVRLATQRDGLEQPTSIVGSGTIMEHGPSFASPI